MDALTPALPIVVFVVAAVYVTPRAVKLARVAKDKRRVLRELVGTRIIVWTTAERGERRFGGVLVKVSRRAIAIDTGGRMASIALRAVRSVGDDRGTSLGTW